MLVVHLVPYRIWGLDPLAYGETVAGRLERLVYRLDELVDVLFPLGYVAVDLLGDFLVFLRFLVFEPDVLHLRFDAVEA